MAKKKKKTMKQADMDALFAGVEAEPPPPAAPEANGEQLNARHIALLAAAVLVWRLLWMKQAHALSVDVKATSRSTPVTSCSACTCLPVPLGVTTGA